LPTSSDDSPKANGSAPPQAVPHAAPKGAPQDLADASPTGQMNRLSQSLHEALTLKVPEKGQWAASRTVPVQPTHGKADGESHAASNQKRSAETLIHTSAQTMDAATKHLCQILMGLTAKPEGFKSLIALQPSKDWYAVVCHDSSQAQAAKGVDHQVLAGNLSKTFATPEAMNLTGATQADVSKAGRQLRNDVFKGSMTSKADGSCAVAGLFFAGTRLCRDPNDGTLWMEPSLKYQFASQTIGDKAVGLVAQLHATLLMGAGVSADLLKCHPNHPDMQPLVTAIKERMAAAA
jgi:hypothetical protein